MPSGSLLMRRRRQLGLCAALPAVVRMPLRFQLLRQTRVPGALPHCCSARQLRITGPIGQQSRERGVIRQRRDGLLQLRPLRQELRLYAACSPAPSEVGSPDVLDFQSTEHCQMTKQTTCACIAFTCVSLLITQGLVSGGTVC